MRIWFFLAKNHFFNLCRVLPVDKRRKFRIRARANFVEFFLNKNFEDRQNRPRLAAILVGNNPASKVYLTHKEAACKEVGIDSEIYALNENCDTSDAEGLINHLNEREDVHGILLQLPLPPQLDERSIC